MMANTGAPIKAVITPIGNSVGEIIVLEIRSAMIKNPLPVKIDKGRGAYGLVPIIILSDVE